MRLICKACTQLQKNHYLSINVEQDEWNVFLVNKLTKRKHVYTICFKQNIYEIYIFSLHHIFLPFLIFVCKFINISIYFLFFYGKKYAIKSYIKNLLILEFWWIILPKKDKILNWIPKGQTFYILLYHYLCIAKHVWIMLIKWIELFLVKKSVLFCNEFVTSIWKEY